MRPDLPTELPLICPACRTQSERGWEMFTVELVARFAEDPDGEVREGVLQCVNCGRKYPIIDGIPVITRHLEELVRSETIALVESDLSPELSALLAGAGPDGDPYPRLVEHVSIYADAQWGDRAEPPPDGPGPAFGYAALAERLAARAETRVGRAVELGCGLGRGLAELARGADLAVGVDLSFGALRRARRILAGRALPYARRVAGRHYRTATVTAGAKVPNVALICGDALDPPIAPGGFERAAALNLLDNVRTPGTLLSVLDGLLSPGGELILGSPYAWQSGIVDEEARLGGSDPAGHLRQLLTTGDGLSKVYFVEEEATLRWWLRRDARSAFAYDVHYLRARKHNI